MAQGFRVPGPLGTAPNNIGGRVPGPLGISAEDVISALRWTNPLTFSGKLWQTVTGVEVNMWSAAEQTARISADKISIPSGHVQDLKRYANANSDDGAILNHALAQDPSFYKGGWLISVNGDADAITFGNSIFFSKAPPDADTYVHEMVHIHQYSKAGRSAFIASYFGLSLTTVLWRLANGIAVNVMNSSPYEVEAYELEKRFRAWIALHP